MLRVAFVVFFAMVAASFVPAAGESVHWFEAEDFTGNSWVVKSECASAGAYAEGRTWYRIVEGIPVPQDGKTYHVWVRAQSDLPANWYLRDRAEERSFGWFRTSGSDKWEWIRIGSASSGRLGETFWPVYLQRPREGDAPTATGRIDVVALTSGEDVSALDELLERRLGRKEPAPVGDKELLEFLIASRRVADVPYVDTPPVIDGILDDQAWEEAAVISDFTLIDGSGLATEQTVGYIAYDSENLYVAAEMLESQIPFIRKVRTIRDDAVWTDDCVEIFIDPGFTQSEHRHFVINPIGTMQDNLAVRLEMVTAVGEEDLDWTAAAVIGDDRWIAEAAIPWRLLDAEPPREGEIWGFNLNREQRPKHELSHWNYVGGQFHQPDRFGLISFGRKPVSLEAVTFAEDYRQAAFSMRAVEYDGQKISVHLTVKEREEILEKTRQTTTAYIDESTVVSFELPLDRPGYYDFLAEIKGEDRTLYNLEFPIRAYSDGLVSTAWPPDMRNNVLHVALNTAQHCFFFFANHFPDGRMVEDVRFDVSVPAGVKILDSRESLMVSSSRYNKVTDFSMIDEERDGRPYRRYIFELERGIPSRRIEDVRFFQDNLMPFFVIEEGAFSAGDVLTVYYNLISGDMTEEENVLSIAVLPEPGGKQPEQIKMWNWLWTFNHGPHTWEPYLDTMVKAGFNSVGSPAEPFYSGAARERNITITNNLWWFWWNEDYLKENPDARAVDFSGGRGASKGRASVCPTIMLRDDGDLIRKSITRFTEPLAEGLVDNYIWNLEGPAAWAVCFCERCVGEFKKFAGITVEQELTPEEIRRNHANDWILFACRQSSLTSGVIRDELKKHNPDATWGPYSGMPGQMTKESYRCNWDEIADHIDIAYPTGYSSSAQALDSRFVDGWKNFIELMDGEPLRENRVRTVPTLTAGYERGRALQPSAALNRMQILRSIASGAEGIVFWWWGPMDGEYYREIGKATAIIAEFEEFFLEGKNNGQIINIREHPYGRNVSYEVLTLGDRHLAILFNHSDSETRELVFSFEGLPRNISGYHYPGKGRFNPARETAVEIGPLDTAVMLLE